MARRQRLVSPAVLLNDAKPASLISEQVERSLTIQSTYESEISILRTRHEQAPPAAPLPELGENLGAALCGSLRQDELDIVTASMESASSA